MRLKCFKYIGWKSSFILIVSITGRGSTERGGNHVTCDAYLTDSRDRALITMVLASSTWAAAVTLLSAITRSCGFCRAAACSPRVTLPEELLSTEV